MNTMIQPKTVKIISNMKRSRHMQKRSPHNTSSFLIQEQKSRRSSPGNISSDSDDFHDGLNFGDLQTGGSMLDFFLQEKRFTDGNVLSANGMGEVGNFDNQKICFFRHKIANFQ